MDEIRRRTYGEILFASHSRRHHRCGSFPEVSLLVVRRLDVRERSGAHRRRSSGLRPRRAAHARTARAAAVGSARPLVAPRVVDSLADIPLSIRVRRLDPELPLPERRHAGDAGYDLAARVDVRLEAAGGRALVPTGISVAIPEGFAGFVQPRSGLALRHGVTCLNSPGLIDAGYRDEISVLLVNLDPGVA